MLLCSVESESANLVLCSNWAGAFRPEGKKFFYLFFNVGDPSQWCQNDLCPVSVMKRIHGKFLKWCTIDHIWRRKKIYYDYLRKLMTAVVYNFKQQKKEKKIVFAEMAGLGCGKWTERKFYWLKFTTWKRIKILLKILYFRRFLEMQKIFEPSSLIFTLFFSLKKKVWQRKYFHWRTAWFVGCQKQMEIFFFFEFRASHYTNDNEFSFACKVYQRIDRMQMRMHVLRDGKIFHEVKKEIGISLSTDARVKKKRKSTSYPTRADLSFNCKCSLFRPPQEARFRS